MSPFWIEVRDGKGVLKSRQQFTGGPVLVGRGPQCSVLLDDAFVAPVHAQVLVGPEGLTLEALPSINGLHTKDSQGKLQKVERVNLLEQGASLTAYLGKSILTLRGATETVAAEKPLSASKDIASNALGWPMIVGMTALMFGIEFFGVWSNTLRESKVTNYLLPVVTLGGFALAWTFFWALLNRVFGGVLNFRQHLYVAMAGILISSVLNEILDLLGYGFALGHVGTVDTMMRYTVAAIASYFHLKIISSENMKAKGLSVATLLIAFFAIMGITRFEQIRRDAGSQTYAGSKAPVFRFKSSISLEQSLEQFGSVQARIDKARKEKPGEGSDFDGLFED
jgi:hypothetical protein